MSSDRGYIPSLDGMRALSICLVLLAHAGYSDIVPGGLGVTIFFFLSGFLISSLLLREFQRTGSISYPRFFARRFFRLFPPLLITLLLTYSLLASDIVAGQFSLSTLAAQLLYFVNYYGLYFAPSDNPEGLGVLWSLAVEEHFYLIYPLALLGLLHVFGTREGGYRWKAALVLAFVCVVALCWRYFLVSFADVGQERTYYATDTRIDSILYGCILALVLNPCERRTVGGPGIKGWAILAGAMGIILFSLLFRDPVFRETARYTLQGIALIPIFYYSVACASSYPFRFLEAPILRRIGVYSYSIYLIHFVIIKAIQSHFPDLPRLGVLFSVILLAVPFAVVIDLMVEPTFRRLRARLQSRTDERQSGADEVPLSGNTRAV